MFQSARRGGSVAPLFIVFLLHLVPVFSWIAPVRLDPSLFAATAPAGRECARAP